MTALKFAIANVDMRQSRELGDEDLKRLGHLGEMCIRDRLMDDHKRLSDQCAELTAQRDSLKAENRTLQERIRELDGELSRMQLTEGLAGGSRNRDKARARVNRLMREVDKCIALLGRPE